MTTRAPANPPLQQPGAPAASERSSLRTRALRGSAWTVGTHAINRTLRLAGNILLARLLFPEAFGLMTLATVFVQGLEMFSDLGLTPAIIQSRHGNETRFLNTAWTVQVLRGIALWLCACLAGPAAASLYGEPILSSLLPVVGLTALIGGFNSTRLATVNRKLQLGRLSLLELGSYLLGLVTMVVWAWYSRSVWALAGGVLTTAVAKMVFSHLLLPGERNRFHWDRDALHALRRFGQWILISTALTFFAGRGDRLILGTLLDIGQLGILGIAATLAGVMNELLMLVVQRVLFPSYVEVVRERPEELYRNLRNTRLILLGAAWSTCLLFIAVGEPLIGWLYDARYAEAGWMLRMLATGMLVGALNTSYGGVLIAYGRTFEQALMVGAQVTLKVLALFVGASLAGSTGVIAAVAFSPWLSFPAHAVFLKRAKVFQPEIDLPVYATAVAITATLYL